MKLLKTIGALSLPRTLGLWGVTIAGYAGVYFVLSALGHAAIVEGAAIAPSAAGFFDSLYYSALHAFTPSVSSQASGVVDAITKSQLALSAGFFGLFVHKAAKSAAPFQKMHYPSLPAHLARILSKLYIFRYDVTKLLTTLEHGTLTRHHMRDLWITASGVDTAMLELHEIIKHHQPGQGREERLITEDLFKRVVAAVDSSFWNLSCLLAQCSKEHIKWNYEQTVESLTHNTLLAEEIIQTLAHYPVDKETLYSLREVQKTFLKLNALLREKEDFGFQDLPDLQFEEALDHQIEQDLKLEVK